MATTSRDLAKELCTGVYLGVNGESEPFKHAIILVVGNTGNGMERVGFGSFFKDRYNWYDPARQWD